MEDSLFKEFKTDIEGLIVDTGSSYCLLKITVFFKGDYFHPLNNLDCLILHDRNETESYSTVKYANPSTT